MLVDAERVLLGLKSRLGEKRSWGAAELFQLIAELEVEHMLDGDTSPPQVEADHEGPLEAAAENPSPARSMPGSQTPLRPEEERDGNHHKARVRQAA